MKPTKYRLAIIENKPIILDALMEYFTSSPNFCLVLMTQSGEQFFAGWQEQRIDLLLCDSNLTNTSAVEVTWYVKRRSSSTQVVIFTVFDDQDTIFRSLSAGASDYLLKNCPLPEIERQLLEVLEGGSVMSPQVARMILRHFDTTRDKTAASNTERLTAREIEIVSLLKKGDSYKQIAAELSVSVGTVKFHIRNVYGKLQLNSRAGLMDKYRELG
ncbi:response regulator [Parapedobacter indicus]|uniref:Two component transcriptional regulator, LuxR family n=1 Tax=Parapedobacter indicus TaxID=1477437 RepID=A0A1I3FJ91_9SPHI|nr:response regulator transcription factor [Parapedobacter indicus]PPL03750.1 LuxR family two component transcriptional regulator [Parapedobacter indicus]SFI11227.1 two component transcriptional regulator, LuxR family [Parapedobacter indicus]